MATVNITYQTVRWGEDLDLEESLLVFLSIFSKKDTVCILSDIVYFILFIRNVLKLHLNS